jgi:L-alanine-DL-glutamate epimerase-like enolase superfamily enzyme
VLKRPHRRHRPRSLALYDAVSTLPLEIESYELERLEYVVSSEFTRVTTVVHLHGAGEEGVGEDVTYSAEDHPPPDDLPLAGSHALDSFSELLDRLTFFVREPDMPAYLDYRRWAFESAALDLALRQAGRSLADAVGREPRPVTFVSSKRLADPQSADQLKPWLEMYPTLRFKLDPMTSWDDELVAELAATGAVDSVDLKGQYEGTVVDQPPDPALYRRVIEGFPEAWIEDPNVTDETRPVLEPHAARITWDAPIHSVEDIENVPWPPRTINIKPSRFGSVRRLFDAYDYCAEKEIAPYGGGQWELGPGRGQIQYLASLFHPDTPNDVAPRGYNAREPEPGLPESPLEPRIAPTGFRWEP